jgi:NAD(P)-dependent dehydrogenase (short-subunit alcohol dehydrogenase family)
MEVAIVTGASKGLGKALARGLAERGWSLVIDARGSDSLDRAVIELRSIAQPRASIVAIPGDVASQAHRAQLVETAERLGRLDLIVNNASALGESPLPKLEHYPLDALRHVLEVNVVAPLALIQQAIGLLRGSPRPRLLNITSDASVEHYEGWGGYGLSKAALDHVSATFAEENPDLRSWAFDPGDLRTDMHQEAFPGEDISDRPMPDTAVPTLLALIDGDLPNGRYKVSDIALNESAVALESVVTK